jgi:hypothetical protein
MFKGDRFSINVVNTLNDDTMERSTSIVCADQTILLILSLIAAPALAWSLPEKHQLRRWSRGHHTVSNFARTIVFVPVLRP